MSHRILSVIFVCSSYLSLLYSPSALACVSLVKESRFLFWANYKVLLFCDDGKQTAMIEAENLEFVANREPLRSLLKLPNLARLHVKVANLQIGSPIRLANAHVVIESERIVFSDEGSLDVTPLGLEDRQQNDNRDSTLLGPSSITLSASSVDVQGDETKPRLFANGNVADEVKGESLGLGRPGGTITLEIDEIQNVPVRIASVEGLRQGPSSSNRRLRKASSARMPFGRVVLQKRKVTTD